MAGPDPRLAAIDAHFDRALDLGDDERAAWLEVLATRDPELAREVQALLALAATPDHRLTAARLPGSPVWNESAETAARPGDRLGPYRIVAELGRGGMAEVYLAERADGAFEQQVALKLLTAGLGGIEGVRRFEQERQILARLEHPAIARLLDGGVDPKGRPFLVMERVDGLPIDRFCDQWRLGLDARLELLIEVARAVEHAHHRLVVHRDLKPTNILVSAEGQVKLLDFGIAKLLDPALAGPFAAAPTRTYLRLLTPEYASPEQIRGEPVTTASDVYQLGLLLFELLTGSRAFVFTGESPAELERMVSAGPARRASTVAIEPTAAAARGASPADLRRALAGDLDDIIARALRLEPTLRYASPAELVADLECYRTGLPVAAAQGSRAYRARKFVRRHRIGLGVAASAATLLLGWAVTASFQAREIGRQRDRAQNEATKAREVTGLLIDLFEVSDPDRARGREPSVGELLERGRQRLGTELADQPEVRAELLGTLGEIHRKLGRYPAAEELLREALELARKIYGEGSPEHFEQRAALGRLLRAQGRNEEARNLLSLVLAADERRLGAESPALVATLRDLGAVERSLGHLDDAAARLERALAIERRHPEGREAELATTLGGLGAVRRAQANFEAASTLYGESLKIRRRILPPDHPDLATSLQNLALARRELGDYVAAEPLFREAVALQHKTLGADHPYLAITLNNLALTLRALDRPAEGEGLLRQALAIRRNTLGERDPLVAMTANDLGLVLRSLGRPREAEAWFRSALEILPTEHRARPTVELNSGLVLVESGRAAEAEPVLRRALAGEQFRLGHDHPSVAFFELQLAALLCGLGSGAEGESLLAEARSTLAARLPRDHPWQLEAERTAAACGATTGPAPRGQARQQPAPR